MNQDKTNNTRRIWEDMELYWAYRGKPTLQDTPAPSKKRIVRIPKRLFGTGLAVGVVDIYPSKGAVYRKLFRDDFYLTSQPVKAKLYLPLLDALIMARVFFYNLFAR